jgi:NAD(P)-dependent dehydrogenase (short-subunit alcohol dehydrogenase family)
MSLHGKVALITGASRGIGKAIALRLSRDGASVVINFSNDPAPADAIVQQLGSDRAIAVKANVAETSEVKRLVKETVDKFGKIDILVNCAGILPMCDLKGTTEETFEKAFGVNVKGPYFLTQVLALMMPLIVGSRQTHGERISCHLFLFHHSDCVHGGASVFTLQRHQRRDRTNGEGTGERIGKGWNTSQRRLPRACRHRSIPEREERRTHQDIC